MSLLFWTATTTICFLSSALGTEALMDDVVNNGVITLEPTQEDLWGLVGKFELPLAIMALRAKKRVTVNIPCH